MDQLQCKGCMVCCNYWPTHVCSSLMHFEVSVFCLLEMRCNAMKKLL
jgi:hypothetical protein